MKKSILSILLFSLITLLVPLAGLALQSPEQRPESSPTSHTAQQSSSSAPQGVICDPLTTSKTETPQPKEQAQAPSFSVPDRVLLFDTGSDSVLQLTPLEYMIGAAASEMPANWPDEALKAQAVASLSYLLYQRDHADIGRLGGAWLAVDPARRQGCMTKEVLQSYWGESFEQNWQRFESLFTPLQNALLLYDGKPAAAAYHAISSGRTEASQNVWDEALAYLSGVDSVWDLTADDYTTTVTYTPQQMYDALMIHFSGISPSGDPGSWFSEPTLTQAGTVERIECCGVFLRGADLRTALGLRSAAFSIRYADNVFVVTTRGYGHGVGLSQWGAKCMAQNGENYQSILAHYFPGTQLCGVEAAS